MIVVDTNVIAYLWLPGTHSMRAERLLGYDPEWAAPLLWRSELRNVVAGFLRRGEIDLDAAVELLEASEAHMRGNEYSVGSAEVMLRVATSTCSAYDCEFVVLAEELGVPLVTNDRRLIAGFPNVAVPIGDFVARA